MRLRLFLACVSLAFATQASAQGQSSPSGARQPLPAFDEQVTIAGNAPPQQPTVACGMTVIPAPNVDPKGVKPVPEGLFTMRLLAGPACQPNNQAGMQSPPLTIERSEDIRKRLPQFFAPRR